MKVLCVPKADINEGLRTARVSRSAMIFFPDVFFVLPIKSSNVISGSESRFNGLELYNEAKALIDSHQVAKAYDFLIQAIPEEHTYYIKMLNVFTVKAGWWIFGSMYFRKISGMKKSVGITSKATRLEIRDMYRYYIQ